MRITAVLFVGFFLIAYQVMALNFDENIQVTGDGKTSIRTSTSSASDLAEGHGEQSYHRNLAMQFGVASLTSEYELTKSDYNSYYYNEALNDVKVGKDKSRTAAYLYEGYSPNHYQINMRSPAGLQQFVSIYGNTGNMNSTTPVIKSSNSINFEPRFLSEFQTEPSSYWITTAIDVEGIGGLSEAIEDLKGGKHSNRIAEARLSGKFNVTSTLTDTLVFPQSDALDLSSKAEEVSTLDNMVIEDENSSMLADLEDMLAQGLIPQKRFKEKLEDMKNNERITQEKYDTELEKMSVRGLILEDKDTVVDLNQLNYQLKNNDISLAEYLAALRELWANSEIEASDYLAAIGTLGLTRTESELIKSQVLDELMNRFLGNKLDEVEYIYQLNRIRDLGIISSDEYKKEISESSQRIIAQQKQLLDLSIITEVKLLNKTKDMLDENRITAEEYDQVKNTILTEQEEKFERNQIDWDEYNASLNQMLQVGHIDGNEYYELVHNASLIILEQLKEMLDLKLIDPEKYRTKIEDLYNGGRITRAEYLEKLKELEKEGYISSDDYSNYELKVANSN